MNPSMLSKLGSPLEVVSLENEIARLYAYIEVLHETHANRLHEVESQARARESSMTASNETIQAEQREANAALMRQKDLELARLQGLLTTVEASQRMELHQDLAELRKHLGESEANWSKAIADRDHQHATALAHEQQKSKDTTAKLTAAVATISELEGALRRVLREKEELEAYIQLEPSRWSAAQRAAEEDRRHLQAELTARRAEMGRLHEQFNHNSAVLLQKEKSSTEQIRFLETSLAEEKRRNDELVVVFSQQIETLHEQLAAAMAKNARLLSESESSSRRSF